MALTFPIESKSFYEIDDLKHIIHEFPGMDDLLRYVCYRFDPMCLEVRNRKTVAEKDAMAASLAKYTPNKESSNVLLQMATHFLRQINSLDWEIYCTLEIAMDQSMQIIRGDIEGLDRDEMLKATDLKQKVINGLSKTEDLLLTRKQKISAGDELAMRVINDSAKARMKKRNTLTGLMEEVEE